MNNHFRLNSSLILLALEYILHGGVLAIACFLCTSIILRIIITLAISIHLFYILRKYVFLASAKSVTGFWQQGNSNIWNIKTKIKDTIIGRVEYPIFVSNFLIIIIFCPDNGSNKIKVPIFKDALSQNSFRKLKILLALKLKN